jgi:hypothetical protein
MMACLPDAGLNGRARVAKGVCLGPALQKRRQFGEMLGGEARLTTRCGMATRHVHALLQLTLEPQAHCPRRDPERGGDILLILALLLQLPGVSPPSRSPIVPVALDPLGAHPASLAALYPYPSTEPAVNWRHPDLSNCPPAA